jgi:sulfatase modifying factor 1
MRKLITILVVIGCLNFYCLPCMSDPNMVSITGGTYQMGDSLDSVLWNGVDAAVPVHTVTLSSFYISKYVITNQQYCSFLNSGGVKDVGGIVYASTDSGNSYAYCDESSVDEWSQIAYSGGVFSVVTKGSRSMVNDPMVEVSWYGAAAYCNWRSQQAGLGQCYSLSTWTCNFSQNGYHLPTEAQWEFAARGGLAGNRFPWGNTISASQANYHRYSSFYSFDLGPGRGFNPSWCTDMIMPFTSPVGSFAANGYGLYDMSGNVWQWCNDEWAVYTSNSQTNPRQAAGTSYPNEKVVRGGSWDDVAIHCAVAMRTTNNEYYYRDFHTGFRIAMGGD